MLFCTPGAALSKKKSTQAIRQSCKQMQTAAGGAYSWLRSSRSLQLRLTSRKLNHSKLTALVPSAQDAWWPISHRTPLAPSGRLYHSMAWSDSAGGFYIFGGWDSSLDAGAKSSDLVERGAMNLDAEVFLTGSMTCTCMSMRPRTKETMDHIHRVSFAQCKVRAPIASSCQAGQALMALSGGFNMF